MPTTEERLTELEYQVRTLRMQTADPFDERDAEELIAQAKESLREELTPEPEPDLRFPQADLDAIALQRTPAWDAGSVYAEGASVVHDGKLWVALPDVATGYAPDAVYDAAKRTGGWLPLT